MTSYVGQPVYVDDFWSLAESNAGHVCNDDWTAAIRKALYCGSKHIIFTPNKTYNINIYDGNFLALFENATDFIIEGNGATLNDTKSYTNQAITSIFWFMGGNNISVTGLKYTGVQLSDPHTKLGYYGATFVRATHGAKNITVQSPMLQHLRYGVLSGSYSDYSYGNCSGFNIDLVTDFCGYAYALSYADNIVVNIHAENNHRAAYQAGCIGVTGAIQCKNQYIAPIQFLMTSAFVSAGRSMGCKDITVSITDLGSTIYPGYTWLAGTSLQRVDPDTIFNNINIDVHLVGTDSVATNIGAFIVTSDATNNQPQYPFNFESWIHINNVTISGTIDRTAQTIGLTTREILVRALDLTDNAHFPTVSNLKFKNLNLLAGTNFSDAQKTLVLYAPGLEDTLTFENCNLTSYVKDLSIGSGVEVIV